MVKYFFLTFRSQPNEKYLDERFLNLLLTQTLPKLESYFIGCDDYQTINSHFHMVLGFPDTVNDMDKCRQRFKTKPYTTFYQDCLKQKLHTQFDMKFKEKAINIKMINQKSFDELYYYLGYCQKESNSRKLNVKGFNEQILLTAIKFYWDDARAQARLENKKDEFKVLTAKTAHVTLIEIAKNAKIKLNPKTLLRYLAKNGVSTIEFSHEKIARILAEIQLTQNNRYPEEYPMDEFEENYNLSLIEGELPQLQMECWEILKDMNDVLETLRDTKQEQCIKLAESLELKYYDNHLKWKLHNR
jgi:hypothetical protein